MLSTYILIIMMFYPTGKYETEMRPVEVPVCTNGVEDSSCGIKACLKIGRERSAKIWGVIPGMNFGLICKAPDGAEVSEGTEAGGGHPALNFK